MFKFKLGAFKFILTGVLQHVCQLWTFISRSIPELISQDWNLARIGQKKISTTTTFQIDKIYQYF